MKTSDTLNDLIKALTQANIAMPDITAAVADTGKFKYDFLDLEDAKRITKPVLAEHGLHVFQGTSTDPQWGQTIVTTMIRHISDQWIETSAVVPEVKLDSKIGENPAQLMAAAISYMMRFQYVGMLNLYPAPNKNAQQQQRPQQNAQGAQLPWLNKEELDGMIPGIIEALGNGETHKQVINNLQQNYKLNRATRDTIMGLQAAPPQQQAS